MSHESYHIIISLIRIISYLISESNPIISWIISNRIISHKHTAYCILTHFHHCHWFMTWVSTPQNRRSLHLEIQRDNPWCASIRFCPGDTSLGPSPDICFCMFFELTCIHQSVNSIVKLFLVEIAHQIIVLIKGKKYLQSSKFSI